MAAGWAAMPLGEPVIELPSCGSTNDELARLAKAGAIHGTVVRADRQTHGRGRQRRHWDSDGPGDLYASLLLRPQLHPTAVPALALVAGIAAARAIERHAVAARLKWPNDIVVGRKKLGGILCEAASSGGAVDHVIVGIGVNIARLAFAGELAASATSIAIESSSSPPSPRLVLAHWLEELRPVLAAFAAGGVAAIAGAWTSLCRDIGARARATLSGRDVSGHVRGLTPTGGLELELDSGERLAVVAGEVSIDYDRSMGDRSMGDR